MAHHCQVPPFRVSSSGQTCLGGALEAMGGGGAHGPTRVAMVTGWSFQGREQHALSPLIPLSRDRVWEGSRKAR